MAAGQFGAFLCTACLQSHDRNALIDRAQSGAAQRGDIDDPFQIKADGADPGIILVSVTAGAFQILGVEPLVAHFFVFYYGVLADITPPVALAAYAAARIAGSNPFKTGNTAFRLGIAKALVPFVFVFSPALLLVVDGFTWYLFFITLLGAMMGIASLGIAFSGYFIAPVAMVQRYWIALVALLFIAPGIVTFAAGVVLLMPIAILQLRARQRLQTAA